MSRNVALGIFLILGLFGHAGFGQKKAGPPVPYIDKGACPFECCTYRQWNVIKPTAVKASMDDKSPISFRLKTGEKVVGMTGVVITTQPGIVRALKKSTIGKYPLNKGDEFFTLTNLGEGYMKIWFKNRIFDGEPYDDAFKFVREPKSIWWVKVRNRKGQIGWSRQPENFGNMDQCG